jgi:hypothetical protein
MNVAGIFANQQKSKHVFMLSEISSDECSPPVHGDLYSPDKQPADPHLTGQGKDSWVISQAARI